MGDPGDNYARLNNANLTLVSHLALDDNPADGNYDISNFLTTIDDSTSTIKGHVKVSKKFDTSVFALYTIAGVTDSAPNWFDIEVAYVSGNGTFTNGDNLLFTFARTGDLGAQGVQGTEGTQGTTGAQGTEGAQGVSGQLGTYAATITPVSPYSAVSFDIDHNLNTTDVIVTVWEVSSGAEVVTDVIKVNVNRVAIAFAIAPASGETYRVVVKA